MTYSEEKNRYNHGNKNTEISVGDRQDVLVLAEMTTLSQRYRAKIRDIEPIAAGMYGISYILTEP